MICQFDNCGIEATARLTFGQEGLDDRKPGWAIKALYCPEHVEQCRVNMKRRPRSWIEQEDL